MKEMGASLDDRYILKKQYPMVDPKEKECGPCPICCEDLESEAIEMPCDPRHIFHTKCM